MPKSKYKAVLRKSLMTGVKSSTTVQKRLLNTVKRLFEKFANKNGSNKQKSNPNNKRILSRTPLPLQTTKKVRRQSLRTKQLRLKKYHSKQLRSLPNLPETPVSRPLQAPSRPHSKRLRLLSRVPESPLKRRKPPPKPPSKPRRPQQEQQRKQNKL